MAKSIIGILNKSIERVRTGRIVQIWRVVRTGRDLSLHAITSPPSPFAAFHFQPSQSENKCHVEGPPT